MNNYLTMQVSAVKENFTKTPHALIEVTKYRNMSNEAKWLYTLFIYRQFKADTSEKFDSNGYSCVKMSGAEIAVELNCHIQKARKALKELVKAGLVEVKKKPGQTNIIYFLDFRKDKDYIDEFASKHCKKTFIKDTDIKTDHAADTAEPGDKSSDCSTPAQSEPVSKTHPVPGDNSTCPTIIGKNIKNIFNKSLSVSNHYPEKLQIKQENKFSTDEYMQTLNLIKSNISYSYFSIGYYLRDSATPGSQDELDELVDIIMDCMTTTSPTIRVGKENKPAEIVRSRFMKLNSSHIEYIFNSLRKTRTEIKYIKNYLITTLYNAVSTHSSHINLQVNHDLYGVTC